MGPKRFENKARREWWSIHVEAWRRSGLGIRKYCRQHRLGENTFRRWLNVLADAKPLQAQAELLREELRQATASDAFNCRPASARRRFRLLGDAC